VQAGLLHVRATTSEHTQAAPIARQVRAPTLNLMFNNEAKFLANLTDFQKDLNTLIEKLRHVGAPFYLIGDLVQGNEALRRVAALVERVVADNDPRKAFKSAASAIENELKTARQRLERVELSSRTSGEVAGEATDMLKELHPDARAGLAAVDKLRSRFSAMR
jgi:hypothetical protein